MNTAVVNIKTDPKIKADAQRVAADLGFSLSALVNAYFRDLIRNRSVRFALDEVPSAYLEEALKESEEDRKAGRFISFGSGNEALKYLDQVIEGKKN